MISHMKLCSHKDAVSRENVTPQLEGDQCKGGASYSDGTPFSCQLQAVLSTECYSFVYIYLWVCSVCKRNIGIELILHHILHIALYATVLVQWCEQKCFGKDRIKNMPVWCTWRIRISTCREALQQRAAAFKRQIESRRRTWERLQSFLTYKTSRDLLWDTTLREGDTRSRCRLFWWQPSSFQLE